MHQIPFGSPGSAWTSWGSLQRSSRPPDWIKENLLLREGVWREELEREGKGKGRESPLLLWIIDRPLVIRTFWNRFTYS